MDPRSARFLKSMTPFSVVVFTVCFFAGCGGVAPAPQDTGEGAAAQAGTVPPTGGAPFDGWTLVDLSHGYDANIPVYPGGVPFELENLATLDQGYYINKFSTGEHVGTHLDAPSHFAEGGANVDQLPLESLMGPIVKLDVTGKAAEENDYAVALEDVQAWEEEHGPIPDGAFVVADSGWWKRWSDAESYLNKDAEGVMRFPGFSVEAVAFLLENRNIHGLGIDTLSTDVGSSTTFEEHHLFLGAGKVHLENLTNLDAVPASGAYLMALPLKIVKGSGAPTRVVALIPKS